MKRELIYAAAVGGCVGALMTMVLGWGLPLGAQSESPADRKDGYFNEITCQRLRVVGAPFGLPVDLQLPGCKTEIDATGVVVKSDDAWTSMVALGIDIHGSKGSITNIDSDSIVVGRTDDMRSVRASVQLDVNEHGGRVWVFGKGSNEARVVIGVNEYGNGAVSTWDKNGYRLANLK